MTYHQFVKTQYSYILEIKHRMLYTILGVLWTLIISYRYRQTIIYLLLPEGIYNLLSTDLTETFAIYLTIATTVTSIIGITIVVSQIFFFLRPGLYKLESLFLMTLASTIIIVFFTIYGWIYPWLIQITWNFFSSYNTNFTPIQLNFEPSLKTYLYHIKNIGLLLTTLGLAFIITRNVLKYSTINILFYYRKFIHLLTLIITAFITPPDPISQLILSTIIITIYELYLFIKLINKKYKENLNLASNQN